MKNTLTASLWVLHLALGKDFCQRVSSDRGKMKWGAGGRRGGAAKGSRLSKLMTRQLKSDWNIYPLTPGGSWGGEEKPGQQPVWPKWPHRDTHASWSGSQTTKSFLQGSQYLGENWVYTVIQSLSNSVQPNSALGLGAPGHSPGDSGAQHPALTHQRDAGKASPGESHPRSLGASHLDFKASQLSCISPAFKQAH